jgi:hypothetical protein
MRIAISHRCNVVIAGYVPERPKRIETAWNETYNHRKYIRLRYTRAVWVWNLVSDIKGGTQTEGVWEQGAEETIWSEEGWSDRRLEKTA